MRIEPLAADAGLAVFDYRCDHRPGDRPFTEVHQSFSLSYVRRGSFGYRVRGHSFDLVSGAIMLGHTGDEFVCTHDHHAGGDACLSFHLSPELVDALGGPRAPWTLGAIPPTPELMILAELADGAAQQCVELGLPEVGRWLAARIVQQATGRTNRALRATAQDRRRAVDAALFLDTNPRDAIDLEALAKRAGVSSFHFLRLFTKVIGVSPHQYRIRCRLRHAARMLAQDCTSVTAVAFDSGFANLSNFVRTFHRAAGVSPGRFRQLAKGDRKILQDRLSCGL